MQGLTESDGLLFIGVVDGLKSHIVSRVKNCVKVAGFKFRNDGVHEVLVNPVPPSQLIRHVLLSLWPS